MPNYWIKNKNGILIQDEQEIMVGDIVNLRSDDNVNIVVENITVDKLIECIWFNGVGDHKRELFNEKVLVFVE